MILASSSKDLFNESFSVQTLIFDKSVGIVVQLHVIETYGIMVMRALRHRGDGGKLIVMRLNALEEYMTDLITWQQKVDSLLHSNTSDKGRQQSTQDAVSKRPHWEPKTKADLRPDVIGTIHLDFPQSLQPLLEINHSLEKISSVQKDLLVVHSILAC